MKLMKIYLSMFSLIIILAACAESPSPNTKPTVEGETNTTPSETAEENVGGERGTTEGTPTQNEDTANPMRDFFLKDGSKANYKGDGNEFAGYKIEVAQPYENYFIIYENNGGVFIRRTYKVGTDKIEILEETNIDYKDEFPPLEEVQAMKPIGIYLQKPFSEGTNFDGWTIVKTNETVETPYRTFDDAIVIEMKENDSINRKYFVQGYGEVKREAIMTTEEDEEYIVTSTLESVDE